MDISNITNKIKLKSNTLFKNDFLLTWDKSQQELELLLEIAEALKYLRANNHSCKVFDSGLAVSLFRDNSTRTRFSFASACNLLGLTVQDLDETKSQISHGETLRETATMISFLSEVIGIRDDMYPGLGHTYMKDFSAALNESYSENVLPQKPPVINLQCDLDHPTQSMADLMHLKNHFGSLENLKGKKIAMTWAYSPSYGKPLSVPQGVISLMTRFGMDVSLAHPEGYELFPDIVDKAKAFSHKFGGSFNVTNSMDEAFKNADIVYPKSWAPFAVMQERSVLLRNDKHKQLEELEMQCLKQNAEHIKWECNSEKMNLTNNALYMHCLPADISGVSCKQGEVSADVFEKHRINTYKQAGYKPYIIAAMIFASKFKLPGEKLKELLLNSSQRIK